MEVGTNNDGDAEADLHTATPGMQSVKSKEVDASGDTASGGKESFKSNREVRDSIFKSLFGELSYLLMLYRILHPEDTAVTEADLQNVTLHPVLALNGLFNDLSFTV